MLSSRKKKEYTDADYAWVPQADLPLGCPYPYAYMPVPVADYTSGRWLEADYEPSIPLPSPHHAIPWKCGLSGEGPPRKGSGGGTPPPPPRQEDPPPDPLLVAWDPQQAGDLFTGSQDHSAQASSLLGGRIGQTFLDRRAQAGAKGTPEDPPEPDPEQVESDALGDYPVYDEATEAGIADDPAVEAAGERVLDEEHRLRELESRLKALPEDAPERASAAADVQAQRAKYEASFQALKTARAQAADKFNADKQSSAKRSRTKLLNRLRTTWDPDKRAQLEDQIANEDRKIQNAQYQRTMIAVDRLNEGRSKEARIAWGVAWDDNEAFEDRKVRELSEKLRDLLRVGLDTRTALSGNLTEAEKRKLKKQQARVQAEIERLNGRLKSAQLAAIATHNASANKRETKAATDRLKAERQRKAKLQYELSTTFNKEKRAHLEAQVAAASQQVRATKLQLERLAQARRLERQSAGSPSSAPVIDEFSTGATGNLPGDPSVAQEDEATNLVESVSALEEIEQLRTLQAFLRNDAPEPTSREESWSRHEQLLAIQRRLQELGVVDRYVLPGVDVGVKPSGVIEDPLPAPVSPPLPRPPGRVDPCFDAIRRGAAVIAVSNAVDSEAAVAMGDLFEAAQEVSKMPKSMSMSSVAGNLRRRSGNAGVWNPDRLNRISPLQAAAQSVGARFAMPIMALSANLRERVANLLEDVDVLTEDGAFQGDCEAIAEAMGALSQKAGYLASMGQLLSTYAANEVLAEATLYQFDHVGRKSEGARRNGQRLYNELSADGQVIVDLLDQLLSPAGVRQFQNNSWSNTEAQVANSDGQVREFIRETDLKHFYRAGALSGWEQSPASPAKAAGRLLRREQNRRKEVNRIRLEDWHNKQINLFYGIPGLDEFYAKGFLPAVAGLSHAIDTATLGFVKLSEIGSDRFKKSRAIAGGETGRTVANVFKGVGVALGTMAGLGAAGKAVQGAAKLSQGVSSTLSSILQVAELPATFATYSVAAQVADNIKSGASLTEGLAGAALGGATEGLVVGVLGALNRALLSGRLAEGAGRAAFESIVDAAAMALTEPDAFSSENLAQTIGEMATFGAAGFRSGKSPLHPKRGEGPGIKESAKSIKDGIADDLRRHKQWALERGTTLGSVFGGLGGGKDKPRQPRGGDGGDLGDPNRTNTPDGETPRSEPEPPIGTEPAGSGARNPPPPVPSGGQGGGTPKSSPPPKPASEASGGTSGDPPKPSGGAAQASSGGGSAGTHTYSASHPRGGPSQPPQPLDPATAAFRNRRLQGSGGRPGGKATRELNDRIASQMELEYPGCTIDGDARNKEEHILGPSGGSKGSTWVDITVHVPGGRIIRIQTVTTLADGVTPTEAEWAAARRILRDRPNDELVLIPKDNPQQPIRFQPRDSE